MNFNDLVKIRQSVREFSDKPVSRESIELCIDAARLAPSACNSQPWSFIVADDAELREKVAKATYSKLVSFNRFVSQAPALVVIVIEAANLSAAVVEKAARRQYHMIDTGIAAEHFCLQAAELGIGTCILGWFQEAVIKELLHIPRHKKISLVIAVGYPAADNIRDKKRKAMKDILHYNRYE